MSGQASLFTAVQIAAALVRSKAGVLATLAGIQPAGVVVKRGGRAGGWLLDQLPAAWHDTLAESARARGHRDAAHLLSDPGAAWQPRLAGEPVTLSDLAEQCLVDAQKLQRALLPSLERLTRPIPAPAADAEKKGLAEYRAAFGHGVSAGHWRRLINRTVDRAGAAADFTRLEVFLADRLTRRVATAPGYVAHGLHLQSLRRALSAVKRPGEPTHAETVFVWNIAFDEVQWLVDEGREGRAAERIVFDALAGSGVRLARTVDALRKSFQRKLAKWNEGGRKPSALQDRRTLPREGACLELPADDRTLLLARAVERGGRISQAWREVQNSRELSPELAGRYIANPANKSYVPRSVRADLRLDVANLEDIHHGPRQAKLNGAWIPRVYSDIGPGDWHQADDATLPVLWYEQTPEGVRAFRGQFLVMVDVKTGMILGFALHSQESYNARIIRSLIHSVHDEFGLPREGFYFENGLWKRSRLLKGRASDEVGLEETEQGLREFVRFKHAKLPRAKVVENILGILQNEMEPLPGYLGRNEQVEKFEKIQRQKIQAASGRIEYGSFLWNKEQWTAKLEALCETYNHAPQGGRLQGRSPREAFEQDFDYRRGLLRLPAPVRYLLANHRRVEKVSKNGVRIVSGGQPYYYRSADTSRLIGQQVLVWHDVEEAPASVTITDLHRRNAIEVPRVDPLPAMTATSAQIGAAQRQAAAHGSYQRTLYRTLKPFFQRSLFQPVKADAATVELGESIAAGRAKLSATQTKEKAVARRVATVERELGLAATKPHRNLSRKLDGLEMLRRADELEALEREEESR